MSVSYRKKTINEIAKAPTAPVLPAAPVNVDFYGEDVFNIEAMRETPTTKAPTPTTKGSPSVVPRVW